MHTLSSEGEFVTEKRRGHLHVQLSNNTGDAAFDGAVAVQIRVPGEPAWATLAKYAPSDIEASGGDTLLVKYDLPRIECECRVGILEGDYTAGAINVRL